MQEERRKAMHGWKKVVSLFIVVGVIMAISLPLWAEEEVAKININQASVEELSDLKGVGLKYAERIVQYREEHGPFQSVDDFMKVPGIGPKTCEQNRDRITVE
jgi:competence protein ComEA